MSPAFAPGLTDYVVALAAQPVALAWATGWLAAALGLWLRAVLPPCEGNLETAMLEAGCWGM